MERERRGFFCLPFRGPTKTPEEMISGTERYLVQGLFFIFNNRVGPDYFPDYNQPDYNLIIIFFFSETLAKP